VVGGLRDLQISVGLCDGLVLGNQLVSLSLLRRSLRLELADDLLGCVTGAFHGGVPGPVWPDEDSHSPWTDFWGPRHLSRGGQAEATLLFAARASIDKAPAPHRHCMYAVWEKASIIYPILIWPDFFLKWTLLAIYVDQ
jgi:hypothetical protein